MSVIIGRGETHEAQKKSNDSAGLKIDLLKKYNQNHIECTWRLFIGAVFPIDWHYLSAESQSWRGR